MSGIQIYYLIPPKIKKELDEIGVDMNLILQKSDKTIQQVKSDVNSNPDFCRNELGISHSYFVSLIYSNVSIYASLNDNVLGLLAFMFSELEGHRSIFINGICSPANYSGRGIGNKLINAVIKIGEEFNVNYINLECKGVRLMNYYKRFGFNVTEENKHIEFYEFDDFDDSDEEEHDNSYYKMQLNLYTRFGGKPKKTLKKLRKKEEKRRNGLQTNSTKIFSIFSIFFF